MAKIVAGSATPISENTIRREISPDWILSVMSNLLSGGMLHQARIEHDRLDLNQRDDEAF
jgi:hypothetical protein